MIVNLKTNILDAFNRIKSFNIPDDFKVKIIMLLSGLKPNLTIVGLQNEDLKLIKGISEKFNINYKIVHNSNHDKIILGMKKEEVEELFSLENKVFGNADDNEEYHNRYGILMGYPACCCVPKIKFSGKLRNKIGFHYSSQNPWSWETCFFNELIFHVCCSPSCKKSIDFGRKHILIQELVYSRPMETLISKYKGFVLHFGENLYSLFSAKESKEGLHVEKIIVMWLDPHFENTNTNLDFTKQNFFLSKLDHGSMLRINDKEIRLQKNMKTHVYKKKDTSDGCLIRLV